MIPHSRPALGPEEEEAAIRVVRSGKLAQGQEVAAFEDELSQYLNVKHVVAVSSGSAALHLALLALDIGPGDYVAMPTFVCSALLHAAQHVQANPLLIDIDPLTLSIDPDTPTLTSATAVIAPHMFGRSVDLDRILSLNMPLIEDCAMAIGARYKGTPLGSHGDIGVFSFYATKVLCAGEGGALATSDPDIADRIKDLRDYDGRTDANPRFNYKLTDLQAAIARVQLCKLDSLIDHRRRLGQHYSNELSKTAARLPEFGPEEYPFRYIIQDIEEPQSIIDRFESAGVSVRRPIYNPMHRSLGFPDVKYPFASKAYKSALSLPIYPSLTEEEVSIILKTAKDIL